LLFYSRYQSDDPGDFSVELTRLQAFMMVYNDSPVHRKPYLYAIPDTISYEKLSDALYRTISGHASLQVMFKYEKHEQQYVQYVKELPPMRYWNIPIVAIDRLPEQYIIAKESSISLLEGYPWRIKFLEYEQQRYLYIEFHAICIDNYSIKCFEDTLFKSLVSGFSVQLGNLSSYRLLRNMEIISSNQVFETYDVKPRKLIGQDHLRMISLTYSLTSDQFGIVRQVSQRYGVDIPVVYQLIVEQLINYCYGGKYYGIIENWRSMLRNYDEIGCFHYLSSESLERVSTLDTHLELLQRKREHRAAGEFGSLGKQRDLSVVYWYEEEFCQHLVPLQADQYCLHDLLIRVRRSQTAAHIQLEIRQESFKKEQIQQCYHRITSILENLRQQLVASCAS
jgi:hypothetical protein